jgi:hypothetical protein
VLLVGIALHAATLEWLSLDDMARKSTSIVRARVTGSYAAPHGSIIYTHYVLQVLEGWKGAGPGQLDVVVPGGVAGGLRQTFSGSPRLTAGTDYVLFLWTGSSGLTHIIGLSQGLFDLKRQDGELIVSRGRITELMLDSAGRPVRSEGFRMRLTDLRRHVSATLAQGERR